MFRRGFRRASRDILQNPDDFPRQPNIVGFSWFSISPSLNQSRKAQKIIQYFLYERLLRQSHLDHLTRLNKGQQVLQIGQPGIKARACNLILDSSSILNLYLRRTLLSIFCQAENHNDQSPSQLAIQFTEIPRYQHKPALYQQSNT